MQAIHTKFLSPTDSRGARIKAVHACGSLTVEYPHELSGQACHRFAAEKLAQKYGLNKPEYGALLGGQLADGSYCFVFDNEASKA